MEELLSTSSTTTPKAKKPSKARAAVVGQSPSPVLVEEDLAESQIPATAAAPVGAATTPAASQRATSTTSSSSTSSPVMVPAPDESSGREEEVIVTPPPVSSDETVVEEDTSAVAEEDTSAVAEEEDTPAVVANEEEAATVAIVEDSPVASIEGVPLAVDAAPVADEGSPAPVTEEVSVSNKETSELEKEGTPTFSVAGAEPSRGPLFVVETHHETEEVLERLLDVKGVTESVSGLWGWMQGSATKVVEAANQAKEQATIKANEVKEQASAAALVAKEQAAAAANVAKEHATVAAAQIQEQTAIKAQQIKEQASLAATAVSKGLETATTTTTTTTTANKGESAVSPAAAVTLLPWDTILPERRAEAKERILKLSMDDQTFTVPPPKEAAYEFDAVQRETMAHRMLDADALLGAKRFKLVPKTVQETEFWRNYFYRVDLIASAIGSRIGEDVGVATPSATMAASVATAPSLLDFDEEMRKDLEAVVAHGDSSENFDMLEDDDLEFDDDDELDLAKELE